MAEALRAEARETEELLLLPCEAAHPAALPPLGRRRLALLLGGGTAAAAAIGALAAHLGGGGIAEETSVDGAVQLVVMKHSDKTCAASRENCHGSRCCAGPGMQCYEQDNEYAQCRAECTQGPDPTHWDGNHWSCAELGSRAPGKDRCGAAWGECTEATCCKDVGFQCYQKNATYATCKGECTPGGPDLSDDDSQPWTCKELGHRRPTQQPWVQGSCSAGVDNCVGTACCKVPGQQCFLQNPWYGNCLTACVGVGSGDAWSCKALGSRTPLPVVKATKLAPWTLQSCSLPSTGCKESRCCLGTNMQCYEKNQEWAECREGCKPGPSEADHKENWTCTELGPRSYGLALKGFPSLYCFSLMQPRSYEFGLLLAQAKRGAGIFECDQYAVLTQDESVTLEGRFGALQTIQFKGAPVVTSQDNTAGNTRLFVNAWYAVVDAQTWQNHSWIVKADPDAVVLPERLRWHLAPHTGQHVFIVNCNKYPGPNYPMMYGSVEVFANSAIKAWAQYGKDCYAPNTYGEDFYMTRCMDHIGVGRILDEKIVGDNLCMGAGNCEDGWTAAFHPFKDLAAWEGCYNTATGNLK